MSECRHSEAYEFCPDEGQDSVWYCPHCESIVKREAEDGSSNSDQMREEVVRWMTEGTDPDMSPRSDCG